MSRLLNGAGWVAKHNKRNQWIQVDLGGSMKITGIATQGHETKRWWVTKYLLLHGQDGVNFATYRKWSRLKVE